ncbi:MAG TPA: hypothetical protein PLF43_15630, partial [Accumulibacter sp.]|nr:hypothetical protein [Accumulibacter sp.]
GNTTGWRCHDLGDRRELQANGHDFENTTKKETRRTGAGRCPDAAALDSGLRQNEGIPAARCFALIWTTTLRQSAKFGLTRCSIQQPIGMRSAGFAGCGLWALHSAHT